MAAAAAATQRYTTSWWWIILPPSLFREVVVVLLLVLLLCFCLAWILEGNIKTAPVEVSSKVWLATVVTWTLMLPSFARKKQTTTPSLRDATMLFSMSPASLSCFHPANPHPPPHIKELISIEAKSLLL